MATATGHTQAIRAKKVIGASVCDADGKKIGKVEDVVLDKLSNTIMFAIIGFGGVAGLGEKFHPVPWSILDYDESEDSYLIDLTQDQLKAAPADTMDMLTRDDGRAFRDLSYDYYGAERYWL
ncbi:MAG: PRC-barrel domain-containing protein [Hyphomonadaceae bacterium]|nr:PRC-barrel domain-containing protein [Hyphomonadaceae bacterium]